MNIKPNQLTDIGDFQVTKCPPREGIGKMVKPRPDPTSIQAPMVWKCGTTQRKVKGANYTMPANDNSSQSAGTRGRIKRD
jgi:hypothetical protein